MQHRKQERVFSKELCGQ